MLVLLIVESVQGVQSALHIPGRLVYTMFPRFDLLLLVEFGMGLDAIWAQRPQAVGVQAVVGDLFIRVFVALDP